MTFASIAAAFAGLLLATPGTALDNGLGKTPQMGWNNYNVFGNDVTGDTMIEMAKSIKSTGLQALGYNYIMMDDVWTQGRDGAGNLVPLAKKFPNGVAAIADELHSMGFKWGMYSDAGSNTCAGNVGSQGHEAQDAKTLASWGVDYLKYDNCHHNGESAQDRYSAMSNALKNVGRPIWFAMCNWGEENVWSWGGQVGNSWRMSGDIKASWSNMMGIVNKMTSISHFGGPGGWNDMDMLEVGNGRLSHDEQVAHFSLWAALKSSLIMGTDITKASADTLAILGNAAVIAISQDALATPATTKKMSEGGGQLWSGPLSGGDYVVLLFNTGGANAKLSATATDIFGGDATLSKQTWDIYDLWAKGGKGAGGEALGSETGETLSPQSDISVDVNTHGAAMFRLRSGKGGSTTPSTQTNSTGCEL